MFLGLIFTVVIIFAMLAVGGVVARTARERGRSPAAWVTLSIVAMLAGGIGGAWSLGAALLGGDDTALSLGHLTLGLLASTFGPLAAMLGVLGVVSTLPERIPTLTGNARWRVYRLSAPDEPAGECELALVDGGALHVGDWCIGQGELDELVADGECLRVTAGGRSRMLMPAEGALSPKEKAKRSEALARRLRSLVRSV